jgi:hypothetical protein
MKLQPHTRKCWRHIRAKYGRIAAWYPYTSDKKTLPQPVNKSTARVSNYLTIC